VTLFRKKGNNSWVFVKEERDLSLKNEYKYKEITNDQALGCYQRWIVNTQSEEALFLKWCLVYA